MYSGPYIRIMCKYGLVGDMIIQSINVFSSEFGNELYYKYIFQKKQLFWIWTKLYLIVLN